MNNNTNNRICSFYAKGHCKNGLRCNFSHVLPLVDEIDEIDYEGYEIEHEGDKFFPERDDRHYYNIADRIGALGKEFLSKQQCDNFDDLCKRKPQINEMIGFDELCEKLQEIDEIGIHIWSDVPLRNFLIEYGVNFSV